MKKKTNKKPFYANDLDAWQHALYRVNLSEAVTPIVRGKTVEDTDTYNKVQQLLDCPDMEHAHEFLLDVDFDELTPEVVKKVDDIYQLAVQQGFIGNSIENEEETEETEEENEDSIDDETTIDNTEDLGTTENNPEDLKNSYVGDDFTSPKVSGCAFTLFYSAMKDGKIRTGESYSNATNAENAKADVIKKLQRLGFTAIDILACEECDPDLKGTASTQPQEFGQSVDDVGEEQITETEEADNAKSEEEPEEEPEEEEPKEEKDKPEEEEPEDEKKEMSRADKIETFKKYLNEFKALLKQMKAESYADMALADRAKFYADMAKRWEGKPDPTEFMSDDNVKQIETMRIKLD